MKIFKLINITFLFSVIMVINLYSQTKAGAEALGTRKYDEYKTPQFCGSFMPRRFLSAVEASNDVAGLYTSLG